MKARQLISFLAFALALQCAAARAVMIAPPQPKPGEEDKQKAQEDYEKALAARKASTREPTELARPADTRAAQLAALQHAPRVDEVVHATQAADGAVAATVPAAATERKVDSGVLALAGVLGGALLCVFAFMFYLSHKYKRERARKPTPRAPTL